MKAFLLAAGHGSRLCHLTQHTPKCLLEVRGKPILRRWLEKLAQAGVQQVLVNTHYLHEQVEKFLSSWEIQSWVISKYEPELLGSAGTLSVNKDFVVNEEFFLVCYVDNWTRFDLSQLVKLYHSRRSENPLGVLALHRTKEPAHCGIAALDKNGWVHSFIEKPIKPLSDLANSGIYLFSKNALEFLPTKLPCDIAYDYLPRLIPRLLGLELDVPLIDIGTPESYKLANNIDI